MCDDLAQLVERIKWQCGELGDDEFDKKCSEAFKKVKWKRGADFGSPVKVVAKDGHGPDEYGYLMTIPPYESDPGLHGVIHCPHTYGEKCDAGPVWETIVDMAMHDFIKRIEIG